MTYLKKELKDFALKELNPLETLADVLFHFFFTSKILLRKI